MQGLYCLHFWLLYADLPSHRIGYSRWYHYFSIQLCWGKVYVGNPRWPRPHCLRLINSDHYLYRSGTHPTITFPGQTRQLLRFEAAPTAIYSSCIKDDRAYLCENSYVMRNTNIERDGTMTENIVKSSARKIRRFNDEEADDLQLTMKYWKEDSRKVRGES